MNRKIKFRAWDNENKYMITSKQGIFTALRNSMNITVQDNGYYNNGDLLKPNKEKYTLMQYTGLKDKNGVEVYEGDKVMFDYEWTEPDEIGVITWNKDTASFQIKGHIPSSSMKHLDRMKVIGNIYGNEVDSNVKD